MIGKLLIANRGEIAVRIIRTARRMGVATVAVYSDADAKALHVALADEAVRIGPAAPSESYLDQGAILDAARRTGADAIHPGYGFLSENPDFVDAVGRAGLIFVGPPAEAIRAMGLKDRAKILMEEAGVPVVPGYHGEGQDPDFLRETAAEIGFPVLIKARAGGGGKGMRRVDREADFAAALDSAQAEARTAFGDPACLIEKYVATPRHIEVQIFADSHGNCVHLFERDCSLQRRHQKVIEEAPAPGMTPEMRGAMVTAAVRAAQAVGYVGAGTVEFIADASGGLDPDGFFFMEMNTRLQVEHPVTEAITGLDLVEWQLRVAAGHTLPLTQSDLAIDGHSVEARLYAEDPAKDFLPATGRLSTLRFPPEGPDLRIDSGVRAGDAISPHYDPMIAKVIVHGPDRAAALGALARALGATVTGDSVTNRAFLCRLLSDPDVVAGRVETGLIARKQDALTAAPETDAEAMALAALAVVVLPPALATGPFDALRDFRLHGPARQTIRFDDGTGTMQVATVSTGADGARTVATPLGEVVFARVSRPDPETLEAISGGVRRRIFVAVTGRSILVQREGVAQTFMLYDAIVAKAEAAGDSIAAPMTGTVRRVAARPGDPVEKGQALLMLEAMKMEHTLTAPRDGTVAEVLVAEGDQVEDGALLLSLEPEEAA